MITNFYKYQGTGNDFVIVDNRAGQVPLNKSTLFKHWCDRRFGIGADGVILLQSHDTHDLEMKYFNANGHEGSMCGNGGRCFVHFANSLGILKNKKLNFLAVDGLHEAKIDEKWIYLKMKDVSSLKKVGQGMADYEMDTGSPHYVRFVNKLSETDVWSDGRTIRHNEVYDKAGINVNFAEISDSKDVHEMKIGTFERGVEDVTLSCGTGVTACSIAFADQKNLPPGDYLIDCQTDGGHLKVSLTKTANGTYQDLWLVGPAACSFQGTIAW